jgi:hypothetical protein
MVRSPTTSVATKHLPTLATRMPRHDFVRADGSSELVSPKNMLPMVQYKNKADSYGIGLSSIRKAVSAFADTAFMTELS